MDVADRRDQDRSWIDALAGWIERLPGPAWVAYLIAILGVGLLINAVFWIDGSLPFGVIHAQVTLYALFLLYWIALYQYLTSVASRALDTFRPLLDEAVSDPQAIRLQLIHLPRNLGLLSLGLGVGFAALFITGTPQDYGNVVPRTGLVVASDIAATGFLSATFLCVILRSLRQLRTVSKLHGRAVGIDLLDLKPAHAFSSLTARTAVGIVLILAFGYVYDPSAFSTALSVGPYAATALVASMVFVIPVIGLRSRLEDEKTSQLKNSSRLIRLASEDLHQQVKDRNYAEMQQREAALRALTQERELYTRVSTWPWNASLFRGFASALLLPIFLWVVLRLLERIL
jgi:hypothetical protein